MGVPSDTPVAVDPLVVAFTVAGQVIVGFSLSLTVTVKLHVDVLPAASVAEYILVVVPIPKKAPLANPDSKPGVTLEQLSEALGTA
jgi:hypothetical protein